MGKISRSGDEWRANEAIAEARATVALEQLQATQRMWELGVITVGEYFCLLHNFAGEGIRIVMEAAWPFLDAKHAA